MTLIVLIISITAFIFFRYIYYDYDRINDRTERISNHVKNFYLTLRYPYLHEKYQSFIDSWDVWGIYEKHILINKLAITPSVKAQIHQLLSVDLVKMLTEHKQLFDANLVDTVPDIVIDGQHNRKSYQDLLFLKIQEINQKLDDIIQSEYLFSSLFSVNVNDIEVKNPSRSHPLTNDTLVLINPVQKKGLQLLKTLDPNSELSFVVKKMIGEDLPQIAIDYQCITDSKDAKQVFLNILQGISRYFDDVKVNGGVESISYHTDHMNNLLTYQRYLQMRGIATKDLVLNRNEK